jgi:outer membrane lipoprotein SlyB
MKARLLAGGALAVLLSACGSDPVYYGEPTYYRSSGPAYYPGDRYASNRYYDDFRVTSIEILRGDGGGSTGAGAVIGGIAGGVIGHQVGSGRGNDAATIAGAVGGAIVGNELEKRRAAGELYRVTVRGTNGNHETYVMESLGTLRVGDRVRIDNGRIYPIG